MDPYQLLPRGKASRVESRSIVDTETTASTGFTTDCSLHPHHLRVGLRPSSSQCCTIIAADLQVLDLAVINRKTSGPSDSLLAQTWGLFWFPSFFSANAATGSATGSHLVQRYARCSRDPGFQEPWLRIPTVELAQKSLLLCGHVFGRDSSGAWQRFQAVSIASPFTP